MESINIDVSQNIKNEISSNDVVLFMKGTPVFPMCGFSAATVKVLSDIGVQFSTDSENKFLYMIEWYQIGDGGVFKIILWDDENGMPA